MRWFGVRSLPNEPIPVGIEPILKYENDLDGGYAPWWLFETGQRLWVASRSPRHVVTRAASYIHVPPSSGMVGFGDASHSRNYWHIAYAI